MQFGNPSAIHKLSFFDRMTAKMAESMWLVANRENRRRDRVRKRAISVSYYSKVGLNGPRAVQRRLRQIARGQLSPLYRVGADGMLGTLRVAA